MADAVAVATVNPLLPTGLGGNGLYRVLGALAISASPAVYVAGGIAMNLMQSAIKAQRTPLLVNVQGIAGYIYEYIAGSDNSNGKLIIRAQTSGASEDDPLGELAASAIPAACSGDTITFEATYRGML